MADGAASFSPTKHVDVRLLSLDLTVLGHDLRPSQLTHSILAWQATVLARRGRVSTNGVIKMLKPILMAFALTAMVGCATQEKAPTRADMMRGHADQVQSQADLQNEIARDWERGQKLLQDGEKRIRDGEERVAAAEDNLARGRDQIERGTREANEGQRMIRDAERRFQTYFPDLELDPDEARR
jgi:hypothetical protein